MHTSYDRFDEPQNQVEPESSCLSLCSVQVPDPAVKQDFMLKNYFTSLFITLYLNNMSDLVTGINEILKVLFLFTLHTHLIQYE